MREIKFRGKSIDNGEWFYGDLVKELNKLSSGTPAIINHDSEYIVPRNQKVDSKTVGQYIGKKDINNTLIYEDDIVTGSNYPYKDDGELNYIGIIRWCGIELGYYIELYCINNDRRGISNGIPHEFCDIANIEVIGNIHDNPELIGG